MTPARVLVAAAIVLAVLAAAVQAGASALYGELGTPGSLPHRIAGNWPFAVAERLGLEQLPPLRTGFARAAVFRGDDAEAQRLLASLGDSPDADDLRGRLALHQGDTADALRWFARAGDFVSARATIDELAARDPQAAYAVVRGFDERLSHGVTSPEIDAEVIWREGQIAAAIAYAQPAQSARYNRLALADYARALALAPNEETYLLAFGYQALVVGEPVRSQAAYDSAVRVVPDSVDAYVGRAVADATLGDCAASHAALANARRFAAQQKPGGLRLDTYSALMRSRLARCPE